VGNSSQADSLIEIAQEIPGFGGLFLDQSGQLNVYLAEPDEQKAKAVSVLSSWKPLTTALSNTTASVSDMKVKKGQYTFVQLYAWNKKIPATDGVYETGIDQSKNKVSIGVKDKAVKNKIINKLAHLNIPKDAVAIYKTSQADILPLIK
jgi:hypothetical protein